CIVLPEIMGLHRDVSSLVLFGELPHRSPLWMFALDVFFVLAECVVVLSCQRLWDFIEMFPLLCCLENYLTGVHSGCSLWIFFLSWLNVLLYCPARDYGTS